MPLTVIQPAISPVTGLAAGRVTFRPEDAALPATLELVLDLSGKASVGLVPVFDPALAYDAALGTLPPAQGWTDALAGGGAAVAAGVLTITPVAGGSFYQRTLAPPFDQLIMRVDGMRLVALAPNGSEMAVRHARSAGVQLIEYGAFRDPAPVDYETLRLQVTDAGGSLAGYPHDNQLIGTDVARVWEMRAWSPSVGPNLDNGQSQFWIAGQRRQAIGDQETQIDRFAFGGYNYTAGGSVNLTGVRAVRVVGGGAGIYSAASPTCDVVIDAGAGVSPTWNLAAFQTQEIEGAGRMRYRVGAGAADPGAGSPLNGADLTIAAFQALAPITGRFIRFRRVFPSDGTILQPARVGDASLTFTV